jgi:hypothetical protein
MVKPAGDGRHTVSLRQLDEFFGGGNTSDLEKGEKAFSIRKVPPVDTSIEDVNYRMPYVFCRDTENIFSAKFYNERPLPNTLVERSPSGSIACLDPTSEANPVTLGYANKKLLFKSGGVLSGKLTSKTANPYFSLIDTQDNSGQSYVQAYRGKTYMGYSVAKSISVDKEGNAGVVGGLTVGGSVSCVEPKEDTNAVTLGYLNRWLKYFEAIVNTRLVSKNLSYTLLSDNTYEVTGIGSCTDSDIVIPTTYNGRPVVSIGGTALCEIGITSIIIPNGVTSIGDNAFSENNLSFAFIPNSVKTIGLQAFAWNSFTSITLPNSVTSIGDYAFGGNYDLTTINVPWAEGEVAGAPWGATNATINYNYTEA